MKGEVTCHSADLSVWEGEGAVTGKKRKGRLDKGTTRGPRKKNGLFDDEEEEQLAPGPSNGQKVSVKASKGKSRSLPSSNFHQAKNSLTVKTTRNLMTRSSAIIPSLSVIAVFFKINIAF